MNKQTLLKYGSCLLYGTAIVLLYNLIHQNWGRLFYYIDGFFIAGASLICFGGLSFVNYQGGFDVFSYLFAKKKTVGGKISLYDYSVMKKEKRMKNKWVFLPYLIVGFCFLSVALILYIFI